MKGFSSRSHSHVSFSTLSGGSSTIHPDGIGRLPARPTKTAQNTEVAEDSTAFAKTRNTKT